MDELIAKIISNQQDIELGQFMQEELYLVQRKIKNRKAAGLDEIPRGMEDKDIWWHTASILQHCI